MSVSAVGKIQKKQNVLKLDGSKRKMALAEIALRFVDGLRSARGPDPEDVDEEFVLAEACSIDAAATSNLKFVQVFGADVVDFNFGDIHTTANVEHDVHGKHKGVMFYLESAREFVSMDEVETAKKNRNLDPVAKEEKQVLVKIETGKGGSVSYAIPASLA